MSEQEDRVYEDRIAVDGIVDRIKLEIIPVWGMKAFRDDPGGLLAYHGFTESDELCASAIQRVLIDMDFAIDSAVEAIRQIVIDTAEIAIANQREDVLLQLRTLATENQILQGLGSSNE